MTSDRVKKKGGAGYATFLVFGFARARTMHARSLNAESISAGEN